MKKIYTKIILCMLLFSPILLSTDQSEDINLPMVIDHDDFSKFLKTLFDRQLLDEEIEFQYGIINSFNDHLLFNKYIYWLFNLSVNLASRDMHSLIYLGAKDNVIKILENMPNGTGLLWTEFNDDARLKIGFKKNNNIEHLDIRFNKTKSISILRKALFSPDLDLIKYIVTFGNDVHLDSQGWRCFPKNFFSYKISDDDYPEFNLLPENSSVDESIEYDLEQIFEVIFHREMLGEELNNQIDIRNKFKNEPLKYYCWLAQAYKISGRLHASLYFGSIKNAKEIFDKSIVPIGTGLFSAIFHQKGHIAITYKGIDQIKHFLIGTPEDIKNFQIKSIFLGDKFDFLKYLMIFGYDIESNSHKWKAIFKELISEDFI